MASPSDSPLFSGPSYFCLLFPFSQWNSEREGMAGLLSRVPQTGRRRNIIVRFNLERARNKAWWCQKGNGAALSFFSERWPKESPLLRYGDKSNEDQVDTFPINRHRTNERTKAVAGSLLLLAQRPFICREAWNLQLFLSFFLILPQLPRESCLFLGPPTTQEKCRVQFHYTERLNGLWLFFAWNLNSVSPYGKTTRYCTKATNNLLTALSRDK